MPRTYNETMTFEDAERIYATMRKPVYAPYGIFGKRIAGNTILHRIDDDMYAIRLYNTDVVRIHRDGTWSLYTSSYTTVTTKERIGRYTPARVFQRDRKWYVQSGWGWEAENRHAFFDGIRVDERGEVVDVQSSASRQHWIETGEYLTPSEVIAA